MFLEKHTRFFRQYNLRFSAKAKTAAVLPITAVEGMYSILDALRAAQKAGKVSIEQPNGDIVELVRIEHDDAQKALTLLFHRVSPDAADPTYRKKNKDDITLRHASKLQGEDQAVSAHLVISLKATSPHVFSAGLEEIPGLSISVIKPIIIFALREYPYPYEDRRGKDQTTYTCLRMEGVKSEDLTNALKKKGSVNALILTRTNVPDAPDSDGIAVPTHERIRYKIVGDPRSDDWQASLRAFIGRAREQDWDDVSIDLSLDDERNRTIKVDRDSEAAEILFVRSEQFGINTELKPCTNVIIDELKKVGLQLANKSQK